ncbi:hypothetical protein B296_00029053 [Ensete ventricosum]|uniref:Uncharacterized protein n=1 Tax=Ensete ventricosum TaxID=4639 RepID=A0A426YAQ0_ENSVE|nr:hypothetical protein B296_00029053 [Ensete ventricosum]
MKLQPDDGPKSSLGIGSGSDDAVGFRREFARRFAGEIEKLTGNTSGDHREKTWVWSSPKEDRQWMPVCLKKEDSRVDVGL